MMVLITAGLFFVIGLALTPKASIPDGEVEAKPQLERILSGLVIGMAIWFASTWILSFCRAFSFETLLVRMCVAGAVVTAIAWRRRREWLDPGKQISISPRAAAVTALFLPLLMWTVFILWRGSVIPPVSHDALSYHLPKALLMVRHGGWQNFAFLHGSVRTTPVNYEWLLAEELAWTGSDALSEWPSIIFFGMFIIAAGALCEVFVRRRSIAPAVAMMCAAALPVVLLHSGAQKNDLMVSALMVSALVGFARWLTDGTGRSFVMMSAAFGLAIGTKPQAAALALCVAPFILWKVLRRVTAWSVKDWSVLIAAPILAFLLLGGAVYVENIRTEGSLLNAREPSGAAIEVIPYGDWRNLIEGPYVLLAAPFARNPLELTVPWQPRAWFWRRYEIYFSHLGVLFVLAVALLPFAMWTERKSALTPNRIAVSCAALAALILMLPVGFKPHGLYAISLPRYALYVVPVVLAWSVPLLTDLAERLVRNGGVIALGLVTLTFGAYALEFGAADTFAPIDYVMWARQHPGVRAPGIDGFRAASVADRLAGPDDVIAVDNAYGAWVYPAFGTRLTRRVDYIPSGDASLLKDDVKWVVIDRAYQIVWGHPDFKDLSQARQYLLRGKPTADDLRLFQSLAGDRRFELVFYNPRMMQAVFKRVAAGVPH